MIDFNIPPYTGKELTYIQMCIRDRSGTMASTSGAETAIILISQKKESD